MSITTQAHYTSFRCSCPGRCSVAGSFLRADIIFCRIHRFRPIWRNSWPHDDSISSLCSLCCLLVDHSATSSSLKHLLTSIGDILQYIFCQSRKAVQGTTSKPMFTRSTSLRSTHVQIGHDSPPHPTQCNNLPNNSILR